MAADKSRLVELEKNFQVFVGIDFGTDGTGLAYALPDGTVFVHQKWKGYKRSVEVKPKTRILLDAAGNFLAFGQPATNSYITMGGEKTGWMLFERFKMALYDSPDRNENKDSDADKENEDEEDEAAADAESEKERDIRSTLTAVNGKTFPSDRVFIEALKYIKTQVFKFFTKNKLSIDNIDDIQWILTVPAIWSEKAKYKMEQWAFRAGLINKEIPNHLKIVYEPDCASLSIQYEIQKLKAQNSKKLAIVKASKSASASPKREKEESAENEESKTQETDAEPAQPQAQAQADDQGDADADAAVDAPDEQEQEQEPVKDEEEQEAEVEADAAPDAQSHENENVNENEDEKVVDDAAQEQEQEPAQEDGADEDSEQAKKDDADADADADEEKQKADDAPDAAAADADADADEDADADADAEKTKNDADEPDEAEEKADAPPPAQQEAEAEPEQEKTEAEAEAEPAQSNLSKLIEEEDEKSKEALSEQMPVAEAAAESKDNEEEKWLKGEKYILIDAGGGTCDVACHEILGDFAVQEIVHPTGGPWGSTYIDDYFIQLLHLIFNKQWVDEFKKEDPAAYTELIDNFRVAKQEFWKEEKGHRDNDNDDGVKDHGQRLTSDMSTEDRINLYADKWHNVQLPFDFCTFLEEKVEELKEDAGDGDECDLESVVAQTEVMQRSGLITLEEEYLRLNYLVWTTQLFDLVVDPILSHCVHLLTDTIMAGETDYICLVGGLGSSKYLQYRMTETFGPSSKYGLNIIIPSRPILSVVDGAARFGLQPDYIQARTLAKTYGNAIDPKIDVIDIEALPPGYLEANQYRCDHTNVLRVRNIFSVYARKNQTIHIHDKPIIRKYKRFNLKQKKVRISVYSSDEQDPKVVKNKPCAKTTVVFPSNSTELSIIVELQFSDTKIRVFAYPEDDPSNKKEMELDYEFVR